MSEGENIIKWIKGQRISWLGHLERMEEDRIPEKMEREVERDIQVLGVRRWRELVADRKKWKDIVRQAKAHSGL